MKQLEQTWNDFLSLMRTKKTVPDFDFFEICTDIELLKIENNIVYLQTEKEEVKSIVLYHFLDDVTDAFSSICRLPVRIEILVDESKLSQEWRNYNEALRQARKKNEIINNASFDNDSLKTMNPFAIETAIKIIDDPSKMQHPVLFYGGTYLERSCFLSAFMKRLWEHESKGYNLVSVSGEYLTAEIVRGLIEHDVNKYVNKYKEADVLVVDSIQVVLRGGVTEHELYLLLSDLVSRNKQVILFSRFAPEQIQYHDRELCSLFQSTLAISIK